MSAMPRVLIVDDEQNVRTALTRALRTTAVNVDTAASAHAALECLAAQDYNLIISDLKMPQVDGIELLTRVKDNYPQVSRMLLSGHAERGDLNNAINLGRIEQYLDKPWNNDDLVRLVAELTAANQQQREQEALALHMDRELAAAMRMQLNMLPQEIDEKDLKVKWLFQSCHRLGGDGLSYWRHGDKLHFFLLDVAGHGAAAGMESFALQHMITGEDLSNPAAFTTRIQNHYPYRDDVMHYFTMLTGCLDLSTRELTYCQAGHPALLVVNTNNFTVASHGDGGFPVGLLDTVEFENRTLTLGEGELLVLHSDGLAEHGNEDLEHFLIMNSNLQPHDLASEVRDWRRERPIDDDISAIFISLDQDV